MLLLGIGGGGDVVSTVPTAHLLEAHGATTLLGGLPWERVPHDPVPGPRSLDEIEHHDPVSATLTRAGPETASAGGVRFTESVVSEVLGEPTYLLDVTHGPGATAAGLAEACDAMDVTAVVGVDAGGDALARGDEATLRSPLADTVMLATLALLNLPSAVGVIGWGSDGELPDGDLTRGFSRAAQAGGFLGAWGVTPRTLEVMEPLVEQVPTEASRLPLEAARGAVGDRAIRGGRRSVRLHPAAAVTFYFTTQSLATQSDLVPLVRDADSLREADRALRDAGLRTELQFEEEWAAGEG